LRTEVYALDGDPDNQAHPYTVSEANFQVLALQGRGLISVNYFFRLATIIFAGARLARPFRAATSRAG